MEWEHFFKPHILDRGYEYYCDDAVDSLNEGNGKVTAVVLGNDRRMKKYPGGPAMAESIAGQWRVLYKNRRAMMEELGKL